MNGINVEVINLFFKFGMQKEFKIFIDDLNGMKLNISVLTIFVRTNI